MLSYEFMVKDGWLVLPQRGFVWAKTEDGGKLRVFSSTCTHLACNVIWREEEEVFVKTSRSHLLAQLSGSAIKVVRER